MRRHWRLASILAITVLASVIYFYLVHLRSAATPEGRPPQISVTENRYVDPTSCADCHSNIWETYQRTGMGRSFSRPTSLNTVGDTKTAAAYYHKPSDSYFMTIERDGRFYQRRHQIGFDGKETNSIEKEIHFVMGSGNHARAFLHRTGRNTLVELPLGWYAEKSGSWAMSPGYDRPDHAGFTRSVSYGCMFCHNGVPDMPAGSGQPGAEPVFGERVPEGIDCQRCHGPGSRHVQAAETAGASLEDIRKAIVNPARLSPDRQIEVCMQCHLQTTSFRLPDSIVRYDRGPFSYRPGEPLADFMLHFDQAPGAGHDDKFEIAGAAYRLRQSACFRESGALGCTTCHNPHDVPRGEEAAAHYTAVCRQCHDTEFNQLIASGKHSRSGDCVGCHMPRRRTDDVVHAVMTDHYIQRRKPARDLLAPMAERRETDENAYHGDVVLYYPQTLPEGPERELYLAVAQVSQKTNLSQGIQRLAAAIEKYRPERMEFYLHLAEAWKDTGQMEKALPLYEEAVRRRPDSLIALERFGVALRSSGQLARAAETLKRALAVDARGAAAWHQLGLVYLGQGSADDALSAFQKAVDLDPDLSEAHNSLGGLLLESGNLARAEPAFREAIRIQPDYAEAHSNLANVLASVKRFDQASYHFEVAIRLKPDYAAARYNYGVALARMNRLDEAQRQMEAALKANPNFTQAREALPILQRMRQNGTLRQ